MFRKKNKVQLSPKLKLGVGRAYSQSQLFKYSGIIFLLVSAALVINAGRIIYKESQNKTLSSAQTNGQVLGVEDQVQFGQYTVVQGDTLFNIAQKFNIDWTTLVSLNNLSAPMKLKVGQVLKVPKP